MPAQIAMLDGLTKKRRRKGRRSRRRSRRLNGPVSIGYLSADGDEIGGGSSKMPWIIGGVAVAGFALWWFKFRKA